MTQSEALDILKTGANVFLTGEPGAGKTHTVNEYVRYLRACKVEPAVTASTGIAATHIGGMTIHSWSGIGIKRWLDKYALDAIASREYVSKRMRAAHVLIIDEVSMLAPETLDMVDAVCREVRQNQQSFGGLQVLLVGDFFQLPPVQSDLSRAESRENEQESLLQNERGPGRFAYQSSAWGRANFLVCYLHEQHRQEDEAFLSLLSAIRRNEFEDAHMERIEARKVSGVKAPANIPRLFSHNLDVDNVNTTTLNGIASDVHTFAMTSVGPPALVESLKKGCLSPEQLHLKTGASVMFTKNNLKLGFVNGTLGKVIGFDDLSKRPVVQTTRGKRIVAEPMEWSIEEGGKVRASVSQLPLRLAWAITVHKSQGMSMDAAVMDLSGVFEFGQGYVALSRVRTLEGLHLLGWNARTFQVHPEVLEQDWQFRADSQAAQTTFANLPRSELAQMHKNFITAVGGRLTKSKEARPPANNRFSAANLKQIRESNPNAYRPWSKADDDKLTKLFAANVKTADLSKQFGRQRGAIRARLRKLGLIE
ncbi:MAG TPA: PIF1 family DEAD/DEAH box helicase [Candidatus Paceibacterota bacterium]